MDTFRSAFMEKRCSISAQSPLPFRLAHFLNLAFRTTDLKRNSEPRDWHRDEIENQTRTGCMTNHHLSHLTTTIFINIVVLCLVHYIYK